MAPPYSVVVVPGISGTTLSFRGGVGGKTKLWYNPTALLKYTPLALALASNGTDPWPLIGKQCFPDGPVDMGVYEPLLTQLANDGLNPVFWPYDWRVSLTATATRFALYLASEDLTSPFTVVGHSMGGLVMRLAYQTFLNQDSGKTWRQSIYLGSPHGGSYWASAMLAGLYGDGAFMKVFGQLLGLAGQVGGPAAFPLAVAAKIAGEVMGSFPALYCLLPSYQGNWAPLDAQAKTLFDLATYSASPGGQLQQWLDLAKQITANLSTPATSPHPQFELNVNGYVPSTLYRFKAGGDPGSISDYKTTALGDGTVPEDRSRWDGVPTISFKTTNHTQLVQTLGPLSRLKGWIATPPTADAVLPNSAAVPSQRPQETWPFIPVPAVSFINVSGDP